MAVRIGRLGEGTVLNSKSEFNQCDGTSADGDGDGRKGSDEFHADKSIKGGHPGYNIIIFPGSVTSHDHSRAKFQR